MSISTFNINFCSYLAGLIEGDGSINIPKNLRNSKNKLTYPSIQISFNSKDFPFLLLLQKNLQVGSIHKLKGKRAYVLSFNSYSDVLLVTNIINGFMRTDKINRLYVLIDYLNQKDPSNGIEKKPLDISSFLHNSWLAGFIEAEGHFAVRVQKNQYIKIACRFELEQSAISFYGFSYYDLMMSISSFLEASLKPFSNKNKLYYRLRTLNKSSNSLLIAYLDKYPLFGVKYLDYLDWLKIYKLFIKKEHLDINNFETIKNIQNNMNDSRHFFLWDHLNNFYKLYN
jgi:hypothetical protein